MLTGFWTVVFRAATDIGAGVVAIRDNVATGGDSAFTYIGPLNALDDGSVSGELKVSRHSNFLPAVIPGVDNYTLLISGEVSGNTINLIGRVQGHEHLTLAISGTKVAI